MIHKHHIIPKHMGGSDDPSNLIELTIEEHAEAHKVLYEQYGKIQDYYAWQGLLGNIGKEDILKGIMNSKEMKEHLSKKSKEYWNNLTEKEREKRINQFLEVRKLTYPPTGKTWFLSEDTKTKMRKPKTNNHKLNMKLNHADFSGVNNPNYGKKHSAETKEKMRLAAIERHNKRKSIEVMN